MVAYGNYCEQIRKYCAEHIADWDEKVGKAWEMIDHLRGPLRLLWPDFYWEIRECIEECTEEEIEPEDII